MIDTTEQSGPVEPPAVISELVTYVDSHGRRIEMFEEFTDRQDPPPAFVFVGMVLLQVQKGGQHGQVPLRFPILAGSVQEAFDRFDVCANAAVQGQMEAMNKPRILRPGMIG